jgi:hypothetical protein
LQKTIRELARFRITGRSKIDLKLLEYEKCKGNANAALSKFRG